MTISRMTVALFLVLVFGASSAMAANEQRRNTKFIFKQGTEIHVVSLPDACVEVVTPMPIWAKSTNDALYKLRCKKGVAPCNSRITVSGTSKDEPFGPISYQYFMKCEEGEGISGDTVHIGLTCEDSACVVNRVFDEGCVHDDDDIDCPSGPCTDCHAIENSSTIPVLSVWSLVGLVSVLLLAGIVFLRKGRKGRLQQI